MLQSHGFPDNMTKVEMLQQFWAVLFLALAVSPFTAPFRTLDTPAEARAVVVVAPRMGEDSPGSIVAALVTNAGRLTLAAPTELAISYFVPLIFLTPFTPPTQHARHNSNRPAVLRL